MEGRLLLIPEIIGNAEKVKIREYNRLCKNPELQEEFQKELRDVVENHLATEREAENEYGECTAH